MERIQTLEDKCTETERQLKKCTEDFTKLQTENAALRGKVELLTEKVQESVTECISKDRRSLLIGDSVVENIDPAKLNATQVISVPAGDVSDLVKKLDEDDEKYAKVFICAGSNACSTLPLDVDATTNNLKSLIDTAVKKVVTPSNVVVSSIPPRADSTDKQTNVRGAYERSPEDPDYHLWVYIYRQ